MLYPLRGGSASTENFLFYFLFFCQFQELGPHFREHSAQKLRILGVFSIKKQSYLIDTQCSGSICTIFLKKYFVKRDIDIENSFAKKWRDCSRGADNQRLMLH